MNKAIFSTAMLFVIASGSVSAAGSMNGMAPNSLTANALHSNALHSNAFHSNALTQNALTQNALRPNGLYPNGIYPNGNHAASAGAVGPIVRIGTLPEMASAALVK